MNSGVPRPCPPRRLLLRGVNWLGDAVMTTPALLRLREALPTAHLTLLTRAKLADLWKSHPALDEIVLIEPGRSVFTVGAMLKSRGFDTALLLPDSPRSALEVWLARIPRRIGYARPWRTAFLTDALPPRPGHQRMHKRSAREVRALVGNRSRVSVPDPLPSPEPHQVHDYLHLAAALGASREPVPPLLRVSAAEVEAASSRFEIPASVQWLGLNPGAEYGPAKRWPVDRFAAAARAVQAKTGCGLLILGGPGDVDLAGQLHACLPSPAPEKIRVLAGRTTLRELMALLSRCRVLLTNDTGPMHLAAALNVPVVVPFGSTSPELTGPGSPGDSRHRLLRSDAPCSPCYLRECPIDFRCMTGIPTEQVAQAVRQAWSEP